jgi:hypothetical protein
VKADVHFEFAHGAGPARRRTTTAVFSISPLARGVHFGKLKDVTHGSDNCQLDPSGVPSLSAPVPWVIVAPLVAGLDTFAHFLTD